MYFWQGQESLATFEWILRAIVTYSWLLVMVKIKGQRQIGRLNAFDFIIAVTFGSVAAGALNNSRNDMVGPFITITTLILLDVLISFGALKNIRFRRIVTDEPLVLMQNGKFIENMLYRSRVNLDDLLLELRQSGVHFLHDVEYAVLEANGKISIIPKSQARAVRTRDMALDTDYEGMPTILIEDGNIMDQNLKKHGLDRKWLSEQIAAKGFESHKNILVAMLDTMGRLYLAEKNQKFNH